MSIPAAAGSKIPKGYAAGSLQQYGPEQMNLFKQLFSLVSPQGDLFSRAMGSDEGFAPYEEQAARDFQGFAGQLGSRFSGNAPGEMSARRSGAFQNLATQGAQDFASQLAMQRQNLQQQALENLMGISRTLLGAEPFKNFLVEKQQKTPGWQNLVAGGLPIAGAGLGAVFGGPMGAALGGTLGGSLASGITGRQGGGSDWTAIAGLPRSWS